MDKEFRAYLETSDGKPPRRRRSYNAFGWAVCLLLLTGAVMASWIGSFYVFSHPENPTCYHFLQALNKIEPPKRFEITAAPAGKFFTAKELYASYLTMSQEQLDAKNSELLRDYLRNYSDTKTPVPYIWGSFTTTGVHDLTNADMFVSGVAAVADSKDCPYVAIEHIYPTTYADLPRARQMLATNPEIRLEKTFGLSAVVHAEKLGDGRILFTVMPIDYGKYAFKQGISSTFRLDPPSTLNLEAGMPVVKANAMEDAVKTFAQYRKNKGLLAKGKMLTLPLPATPQQTALYTAQDVPAEAYQPLPKPEPTEPAVESAPPENTTAASDPGVASSTPMPVEDVPPATTPVEPVTASQPAPESPQTASMPPQPVSAPAAPMSAPVASTTSVLAEAPSLPHPSLSASAAPAATLPPAAPLVKMEKTAIKPAVTTPPAPALATITRPPVSKPKAPAVANVPPRITTKPAAVSPPSPVVARVLPALSPMVPRAQSVPMVAPPVYANAVSPEPSNTTVKLEPFMAPQQQPQQQQTSVYAPPAAAPARSAAWRTYQPGTLPPGRLLTWQDAPELASLGIGRERVYMQGRFIVTASSEGRAVLRPVTSYGGSSAIPVRLVVEYPGGTCVPMEGTPIARGGLRPFQIIDVRRGNDGQVNVYAREITEPLSSASNENLRYNRYRMAQGESTTD